MKIVLVGPDGEATNFDHVVRFGVSGRQILAYDIRAAVVVVSEKFPLQLPADDALTTYLETLRQATRSEDEFLVFYGPWDRNGERRSIRW